MRLQALFRAALHSLVYGVVGLAVLGVVFWLIAKSLPFSLRKEIEDDQNTSLGLVIGGVFVGIAIILAAAIEG